MFKEDEITLAQEEARAEGRKEGRVDMLIKIAEILSDETIGFPGFTGNNLELALNELGLRFGRGQGKRFIVTNEDSGKYRFNQYDRPTIGDMVEISSLGPKPEQAGIILRLISVGRIKPQTVVCADQRRSL